MALEALLPSEVARLVYGYLIDEKCMETAKAFLNESPNLQECRSVLSNGRHFTTRVCGHALMDILEKFCTVNSFIHEKIENSYNLNKLQRCGDLVNQVKFLLEEKTSQEITANVTTSLLPENAVATETESPTKSHIKHSSFGNIVNKSKFVAQVSQNGFHTQTQQNINQTEDSTTIETTLLKHLPGYVNSLQNAKCEADKFRTPKKSKGFLKTDNITQDEVVNKNFKLQETQKEHQQRHNDLNKNDITAFTEKQLKQYTSSEVQTSVDEWCNLLDKNIMTDPTEDKLKNRVDSEVQTSNVGSPASEVSPPDECVEILSKLTSELLNRTEIQERIATNINEILEPIKSNLQKSSEEDNGYWMESNNTLLADLSKVVETAVNATENDPEILKLINEIVQPHEEVLSTEDEVDMDISNDGNQLEEKFVSIINQKDPENNDKESAVLINNDQYQPIVAEVENVVKSTNTESTKYATKIKVTEQEVTVQENIQISVNKETKSIENNNSILPNSLESPILPKPVQKTDGPFTHNNTITSTPFKTFTAVQNFDTCDWFSTQDLPTPNIAYNKDKDTTSKQSIPYAFTACETITTTSFFSPIISKDTSTVAEKIIDQTLHTPDVVRPPKVCVPNNITTSNANQSPKNKTPVLQKTSEVIDELLNANSLQRSNGNADNLSALLKDSNEYNKMLGIETIILYGMDNNINSMPNPVIVPEIEIDDSITLIGAGLSPFLKIHKKSDENNAETKKNVEEAVNIVANEKPNEFCTVIEKNNETSSTKISNIEIVTKNTPKTFLEDQSKNNRLNLSTPKKQNNYIRALDFDAPRNRCHSEGDLKNNDICQLSETVNRNLKSSCVSYLFQSPPFTSDVAEHAMTNDAPKPVVQAVTNSIPLERNSDGISINGQTTENKDKTSKQLSLIKKNNAYKITDPKKNVAKKSWDSDLRLYLGPIETKPRQNKRNHKKKLKEDSKKTPKKSKKEDKSTPKKSMKSEKKDKSKKSKKNKTSRKSDSEKEKDKDKKRTEEAEVQKSEGMKPAKDSLMIILSGSISDHEIAKEKKDTTKLNFAEVINLDDSKENESSTNDGEKNKVETIEKMQLHEDVIAAELESIAKNLSVKYFPEKNSKPEEHKKKQTEEITIEKTVDYEKIEEQLSMIMNNEVSEPIVQKKTVVIYDQVQKIDRGKVVQRKYARLKTLETNLSQDKIHSPLNQFTLIDLETPRKDENTLYIPPTPQIMSPGSSLLMMPHSKLSEDSRTILSLVNTPLECPLTPNIVLTPPKKTDENTVEAPQKAETTSYYSPTLTAFEASNKSEITQFEVIKENLKDNKPKSETKTSTADENAIKIDTLLDYRETDVLSNSKNSDASSSSSSSCTCDSCTSSLSSGEENDASEKNEEDVENKVENVENVIINIEPKGEVSPMKVFTVNKTNKEIQETVNETPAKDENLIPEVDIFETPNVSRPTENRTNLNTKISEIMIRKEQEEIQKLQDKPKPKIISVEEVLPKVITKPPTQLMKALPLNIQMKALEVKNESSKSAIVKRLKVERSEAEIAKAIESITNEEKLFNKSQEKLNKSNESIILSPDCQKDDKNDTNSKIELVKAIESITKSDTENNNSSERMVLHLDESSSEANLELVLEEDHLALNIRNELKVNPQQKKKTNISELNKTGQSIENATDSQNIETTSHKHNTRFQSRQKVVEEVDSFFNNSYGLSNNSVACQEMSYIFDEENYKRRRRKAFADEDLAVTLMDVNGEIISNPEPTAFEMIFFIKPTRKKREKKIQVANIQTNVQDDDNSQDPPETKTNNDNVPEKISNKRKRSSRENENSRKRKKNIFVY